MSPVSGLSIEREPFGSTDAARLVAALDAELATLYTPDQRFGPNLKPQHLEEGRGAFFVARDAAGRAVGCGAVRFIEPGVVEVKRMYVEPDYRGRGVGRAVLSRLEATAREMGATRAVLETGVHQEDAITLYRRAGFTEVGCWGEYASAATSVCFGKGLV